MATVTENGFIDVVTGSETVRVRWTNLQRTLTDPVEKHDRVLSIGTETTATLWSSSDSPSTFELLIVQVDPDEELANTATDKVLDVEITADSVVQTFRVGVGTPLVLNRDDSGGADIASIDGLVTQVRVRNNGTTNAVKVRCLALKGA